VDAAATGALVVGRSSGALSRACLLSNAGGTLCADADWPRRSLDLQGEKLPLALLVPYLPERDDGRPWVFSGEAGLTAHRAGGNAWRGTARSPGGRRHPQPPARRDLAGYRDLSSMPRLNPRIGQPRHVFNDDGRIDARISTGWDGYAPLAGEIKVSTDELTWMELFSPDIVAPTGRLDVDLRLGGTRAAPAIGGEGHLQGFASELPALGIAARDGDLRWTHRQTAAPGSAAACAPARRARGRWHPGLEGPGHAAGASTCAAPMCCCQDTRQLRAVANPDLVVRYRAARHCRSPAHRAGKPTSTWSAWTWA
jgi:translocation and assembly module TamB